MKKNFKPVCLTIMLVVIAIGTCEWALVTGNLVTGNLSVAADNVTTTVNQFQPVDDDMHHFMEYVFEPNYRRLKVLMAAKPKDKQTWKSIKGDSLTLAECANLLLARAPDEDADQWRQISMAVRTSGENLYQAARKSDYGTARKAFVAMLTKCNSCHNHFAGGEHQLTP